MAQSNNTHYSLVGAGGEVQFASAPDNCTTLYVDIFATAAGSQGKSPNGQPFADATVYIVDSCTNPTTSTFESGSTSTFQLASQGGNGTDTPRAVTASGQIPLNNASGAQVNVLNFTMTLNRVGSLVYEIDGDNRSTYPPGSPLVIDHFANTVSLATTATLTVSTQSLGALLPLSVSAVVQNFRYHEVDITR